MVVNDANYSCCIASTTSPEQKTNNDHVVDWGF